MNLHEIKKCTLENRVILNLSLFNPPNSLLKQQHKSEPNKSNPGKKQKIGGRSQESASGT